MPSGSNTIPPESQAKVFEPFRRLHPEMGPGSGLGLVAVRRMVARHGGTVSLESLPGRGSKFVVRLPIASAKGGAPVGRAPRPKVLIVEDDALDAKLIQRMLGDSVVATHVDRLSGAEESLRKDAYDLVLLDLSLPDGHGLELVRRMRTLIGTDVPIVLVTGHGEGLAPGSLSETISGYVTKADLQKERLEAVVHEALYGRGGQLVGAR